MKKTVSELPINIKKNSVITLTDNNVSHLTHGIHKYPGKFIPQLPEWALKKYESTLNGGFVLDPFCGSGTTLLECTLNGVKSIGVDIDPLSCLISKVKSTPISEERLDFIRKEFSDINNFKVRDFKPTINNLSHWFTNDAVDKLSGIRTHIEKLKRRNLIYKDEYDLLIITLSSIVRKVSNADNRSQKTYVSHTRFKKPSEVFKEFKKSLKRCINDIKDLGRRINGNDVSPKVLNSNSSSIDSIGNKYLIELMITSPPYIKSIDYIYNQMVELFWIGDIFDLETQPKQNEKKRTYLGAKNILKKEYSKFDIQRDKIGIKRLDDLIRKIYCNDDRNGKKHAFIVFDFFCKMVNHLESAFKAIKNGGNYVMIVGNSSVSGYEIESANFICKLGERAGFKCSNFWSYEIRNRYMGFDRKKRGGLISHDHVIEFKK